jgi:hypothetical protein
MLLVDTRAKLVCTPLAGCLDPQVREFLRYIMIPRASLTPHKVSSGCD